MSAVCGVWRFDGRTDAGTACARMLSAQAIYGPHHGAQWDGGAIALGRRLFRNLPEDIYDRQPLTGGDGTLRLVADLRLDNRDELERELQISPDRARLLSDADILLAAWERWEEACLERLVGDYAFALWDERRRRLVLARDPLGERPLHYHLGSGFLAFASMPKGLHALPEIPRAPNEDQAAMLVALMPAFASETQSFFEGIERVRAGGLVAVTASDLRTRYHWEPRRRNLQLKGPEEYAEALRFHLDQAVHTKLRGCVSRVGAHLSSGWDSSAVAATAARLLAPKGGSVIAFTAVPRVDYDGPSPPGRFGDEGPLAAATAALYPNIEHVLVRSNSQSPIDHLDRDVFLVEEPLANPSNGVWGRAINKAAHDQGLSIVLSGEMGNITLTDDGLDWLAELIAHKRWTRWLRETSALTRNGVMNWRGALGRSFGPWIPQLLWRWHQQLRGRGNFDIRAYTAINPARLVDLDLKARAKSAGWDFALRPTTDTFATRLRALRDSDGGGYRKGWLAESGVEVRDPTTDRRLVEFSLSVPMEQIVVGGRPRALARRALADRLPMAVLDEPRRGLQAIDWHEGLTASREELAREVERLAACPSAARTLDVPRLRRLIEGWPTEGWDRPEVQDAYRLALLRGVAVGHFLRKTSGANQ